MYRSVLSLYSPMTVSDPWDQGGSRQQLLIVVDSNSRNTQAFTSLQNTRNVTKKVLKCVFLHLTPSSTHSLPDQWSLRQTSQCCLPLLDYIDGCFTLLSALIGCISCGSSLESPGRTGASLWGGACSPHECMDFLRVLQFPPTIPNMDLGEVNQRI